MTRWRSAIPAEISPFVPTPGCPVPIDLIELFGPFAAMHAALDRVGIGRPCAITARLPGRRIEDATRAVAAARRRFPLLGYALSWEGSRPVLVPDDDCGPFASDDETLLSATGAWRVRLSQEGADVRIDAVFPHAIADGLSMLAFVGALADPIALPSPTPLRRHPPERSRPSAGWLARFVIDQQRRYRSVSATATTAASWCRVPREESERAVALAAERGSGFAGWLAAAALRGLRDTQDWRGGAALLNVPIARDRGASASGFGFAIGSLLLLVPIDPLDDVAASASRISERLRAMAAAGWDREFERFLGRDPRRHLAFAHLQRRRVDPVVTVSWKGRQAIDRARDIACFAMSPSAHISSHIDDEGLSISLTAPLPAAERHAVLRLLVASLGCTIAAPIRDFA